MALSKPLFALLVLFSLFLYAAVQADVLMADSNNNVGRTLLQKIDCEGACDGRCAKASRQKICKRACGTCCERCNCVPPGTSGNRDVCPCYANMTTHDGKLKCP